MGASAAVFDDDGERLGASPGAGLPDRMAGVSAPGRRDDGIAVVPIRAGQETLGWLAIGPGGGADSHSRRTAIDHGTTVIALDLMRERAAAEADRRVRADLLDELLAARAGTTDASRLARKAARLGLRIRGRVWAVVIAPDDPEGARAVATDPIAQRVSRTLADAIDVPGGQVVARGTTFVLLVPGEADLARVEQIARAAADAAQARTGGYGFSAGIGSGAGGPGELRRLVSEAEQALALVQRGAVAARCRPTRVSESIGFSWRSPTTSAWARMSRSGSGISSVTMSGDRGGSLIETLEAVVAEGWNLRAAARRLSLHTNTLHYRLGRVQDVSGRDLDDPTTRLALAVALRGYLLLGALRGASGHPLGAEAGLTPRSAAEG